MKETLQLNLSDPTRLESLYRSDKSGFRKAFFELFPTKPADPNCKFAGMKDCKEESTSYILGVRVSDLLVILIATANCNPL